MAKRYSSPSTLAAYVARAWHQRIGGEWNAPPLPQQRALRELFETAYVTTLATEEGRPLQFTLCCTPKERPRSSLPEQGLGDWYEFQQPRSVTANELRRLAPATDPDSTMLWLSWEDDGQLRIRGLVALGPGWAGSRRVRDVRVGSLPFALIVRATSPGRLAVYQQNYLLAELRAGAIREPSSVSLFDMLGIHGFGNAALKDLSTDLVRPEYEYVKEWAEYEFLSWHNTILSIVNAMQDLGHGGALIVTAASPDSLFDRKLIRTKYGFRPERQRLRATFVAYMNARHRWGDAHWIKYGIADQEKANLGLPDSDKPDRDVETKRRRVQEAFAKHLQSTAFVGGLSGVDGAILVTNRFDLIGFGAEILADLPAGAQAYEVADPLKRNYRACDPEQFGMRHRSALKLCACEPNVFMFIVSQDGDTSLAWNDGERVLLKQGVNTTNANMVLA